MNEKILYLTLSVFIIVSSTAIPSFAEVTSLNTNAQFYKGSSKINFTGTVLDTDPPNVTILIFNPNNQFIMLASGIADSNHQFRIILDTGTPDSQQKLSMKGIYNATAFVAQKENGKTVSFVFSPDGSPIVPSPPTSLTASTRSSTEIDLSWSSPANNGGSPISGYMIERNNGTGFFPIQNILSTSYQNTGLTPNLQYSYRVSAINSAGTSSPSNVVTTITLSPSIQPTTPPVVQTPNPNNPNSTSSLDELLKKRIEDAKRIQELLHGQTPVPITSNKQHNVNPMEVIGVVDSVNTDQNTKSTGMPENNIPANDLANFDVKNIVFPMISLVGVGIVVAIFYFRKKRKPSDTPVINVEPRQAVELAPVESDDDAMMILKNRLAKGEISVEEFKVLKDELSEL